VLRRRPIFGQSGSEDPIHVAKLRHCPAFAPVDDCRVEEYFSGVDYRDRITVEPGKRSGKPCIRGLRITVQDVLEYLASGMSMEEVLHDFPDLSKEDIVACLQYAADRAGGSGTASA